MLVRAAPSPWLPCAPTALLSNVMTATPRLEKPRVSVPAGSVGIGGRQTGVYSVDSPGGWRLIGRTSVPLYDPRRDPPALLSAGDRVRFLPVEKP